MTASSSTAALDSAPGAVDQITGSGRSHNPWIVLAIVCTAQFMVILDSTIVTVALPSIQRGLHFSVTGLQWVTTAYTLVFGGFLLLGGRLGDLLGRRRLFLAGLAVFTGASLLNGLATTSGMLVGGRVLQGLGGALLSPAALSILTTSFPDAKARTKALGVWSMIAAGGGAVGLLLGGVLTEAFTWQWIFIVNVPVGVGALFATRRLVPESRQEGQHRSFDVAGALTVTGGLMALVYAIVQANSWGWASGRTLGVTAVALVLLALFGVVEARSRNPLLRLAIFRVRGLAVADSTLLLLVSAMFAMFFFSSLYVQNVLGYSPIRAGLAFIPLTIGITVGAIASQQLMPKLGLRMLMFLGFAIAAVGMVLMTRITVQGSYPAQMLPAQIPMAIGVGLVFVPITLLGTSGVPDDDAGLASGLYNTMQQVGGALGLAALSSLAASRTTHALHAGHSVAAAQVAGFHAVFIVGAALLVVAAVAIAVLLRKRHVAALGVVPAEAAAAAA